MKAEYYWGIDTEASNKGKVHTKDDIHTIQVCRSDGEHTGRVFWNAEEFKEWLQHDVKPRPKILYAFTLPFEYGTLAAWELLNASDQRGQHPWQQWADRPINLFYIKIHRTKIAIFDTRIFFYQLRHGNNYLTNLKAVGEYLTQYYKEPIEKLPIPINPPEEFGTRPPNLEEREAFKAYGIRDAFISAKAAQWIHENIINKWLGRRVSITKLFSWGTVAKHYFNLPKTNRIRRYGRIIKVEFPNQWHQQIYHKGTFAGRSEAFWTGNVGEAYYNDVSSLYPTSIIQSQCMLIKNVVQFHGNTDNLAGQINWRKFYEVTGYPYGWIEGVFHTDDDLWGLPMKVGMNNWYVTGTRYGICHTLDLEASRAKIRHIKAVLVPEFEPKQAHQMKRFEDLTMIKLDKKYKSEIEAFCIKNTTNSTSGILGKARPHFGDTTNIPSYNTLLAQSHLFMSHIFHRYHSPAHPVLYTDTDSFFWDRPVEEIIEDCRPYPTLPFQTLDTVPLEVGVRGSSRPEGTVLFRGKMYYQNENSMAFSGWKPFPRFFIEIIKTKPTEIYVERQVNRKWKTRDKAAVTLKVGRWFIKREHWSLNKLKQIFRADTKRHRPTQDSYQLFLDDRQEPSRSWTITEAIASIEKTPWIVDAYMELSPKMLSELERIYERNGD